MTERAGRLRAWWDKNWIAVSAIGGGSCFAAAIVMAQRWPLWW